MIKDRYQMYHSLTPASN